MKTWHPYRRALMRSLFATLVAVPGLTQEPLRVASPCGRNEVSVEVRGGVLHYSVQRNGRPVILPSVMGFEFANKSILRYSLRITGSTRGARDTTWTQPWGEVARVREHYNELRVSVAET